MAIILQDIIVGLVWIGSIEQFVSNGFVVLQMRRIEPRQILFYKMIVVLPTHKRCVTGIPAEAQKLSRVSVEQHIELLILVFLWCANKVFQRNSNARTDGIIFDFIKRLHHLTVVYILLCWLFLKKLIRKLHMQHHNRRTNMRAQINPVFKQIDACQPGIFVFGGVVLTNIRKPVAIIIYNLAVYCLCTNSTLAGMNAVGFNVIVPKDIPGLEHLTGAVHIFALPVLHPLSVGKPTLGEVTDLTFNVDPAMKIAVVVSLARTKKLNLRHRFSFLLKPVLRRLLFCSFS